MGYKTFIVKLSPLKYKYASALGPDIVYNHICIQQRHAQIARLNSSPDHDTTQEDRYKTKQKPRPYVGNET